MAYLLSGSSSTRSVSLSYKANTSGTWRWEYILDQTSKTSAEDTFTGSWTSKDSGTMTKTLSIAGTPTNTQLWGSISTLADSVVTYYFRYYTAPAAPSVYVNRYSYDSTGTIIYVSASSASSGNALTESLTVSVNGVSRAYTSGGMYITVPYNGSTSATVTVTSSTSNTGSSTTSNKGTATLSCNHSVSTTTTVELYASRPTTYYTKTLAYNANGGTGAPSSQTNTSSSYSTTFTIPTTIPTRDGYTFQGWGTTSTGSAVYQPGDTISVSSGTTTLWAVWETALLLTANVGGQVVTGRPYVKKDGVWHKATKGFQKELNAWQGKITIDTT